MISRASIMRPGSEAGHAGPLFGAFMTQMKPRPRLLPSQWAEKYIYLPAESSAISGLLNLDMTPYSRGIMDAAVEPGVHVIVVETCAQIGKSTALNMIMAYFADQNPTPMLMIQPTLEDARDYSLSRLAPMFRDSPRMAALFPDSGAKRSDSTILRKQFPGGRLVLVGSNSASGLSSRPIGLVLADEIDRYETTKEGNAIDLARKRMTTFQNWLLVLTSTPGDKRLSDIDSWYQRSDKRNYLVPCAGCASDIPLQWKDQAGNFRVVWDSDGTGKPMPETARYCCQECGVLLDDTEINAMVRAGHWEATSPFNGIAGFGDFPEIYSPFRRLEDTVRDFLDAKQDTESLRVWVNTALGQPWEDEGEEIIANEIMERAEPYGIVAPMASAIITAQVDVQDDRLEALTEAWGRDEASWALEHKVFRGDPGVLFQPDRAEGQGDMFDHEQELALGVWNQLDNFLRTMYDHESGLQLPIYISVIDTGGHFTDQVYAYVKARRRRNVIGIKGSPLRGAPVVGRPSKKNKARIDLYPAGVFTAKEVIASRLKIRDPRRPGYKHYPDRFDMEFFEQLTSEKKVYKMRKGKRIVEWVKTRARNEAWDMSVYGLVALRIVCPSRDELNKRVDALQAKIRERDEGIPAPQSKKRVRRMRSKVEI